MSAPPGKDLGRSQGTDFYGTDDLLTDADRAVRDRVRAFVDDLVVPAAPDYWERAAFPHDLVAPYAALRVAGGAVTGYGCPGLSPLAEGLVTLELARGDGSFSTFHGVHSGLAMTTIGMLGSDEQRQRWLPGLAACDALGAFALTEPDHGSDVVRLGTRAHRDGDAWVLDGAKRWIGLGTLADVVVVWARDDDGDVGAFVVDHREHRAKGDHGVPGYLASVITGKSSNRGVWQADIRLDGVRVPADHRLERSRSFKDTNRVLAKSRQTVAWEGLGHAIGAYECALAYARGRE